MRRAMSTAQLVPSAETEPTRSDTASSQRARIAFRQPVSGTGFIDAAWWPRSRDLSTELPPLLDALGTVGCEITRFTYNLAAWEPAPRRLRIQGRTVRLGGFATSDPRTVRLCDAWARERLDLLVIAPGTEPSVAERALLLAGEPDGPYRAEEILARAADPADHARVGAA